MRGAAVGVRPSVEQLVWAGLAIGGLNYARKAVSGPRPFRLVSAAISRDDGRLLAALRSKES
jgi:hypothetical protein